MSEQDLDTRIRALVARAVADAPTAPELDAATTLEPRHRRDDHPHRGWWLGGGAALLAAAAAITAVVLVNDTDDRISTPVDSTPPRAPVTSPPSSLPATSVPPSTQLATSPPSTQPATSVPPSTVVSAVPPPTAPASTAPPVTGEVVAADRLVMAGPDGVGVLEGGAELRRLDQAAEVAYGTPGGAVIFQPARSSPDGEPGDPLIWRPDGTVDRLLGELPAGQSYRLYDVADVAGVPTVLYGLRTRPADGDPAGFEEVLNALTMAPGGWRTDELGRISTWEGGYSRLSLSAEGLVVGETTALVSRSLLSVAVPGSPAALTGPITPEQLGVAATYGDCDCPRDFAVSADSSTIVWSHGTALVVHPLGGGGPATWTVPELAGLPLRSLDVRAVADGTYEVVLNAGRIGEEEASDATVLTVSPDGLVTSTPTGGRFASFG